MTFKMKFDYFFILYGQTICADLKIYELYKCGHTNSLQRAQLYSMCAENRSLVCTLFYKSIFPLLPVFFFHPNRSDLKEDNTNHFTKVRNDNLFSGGGLASPC